jgi:transposase
MRGRTFSREFKLQVVRQVVTGERRPAQVCRAYNLSNTVLTRWRAEYAERGERSFEAYQESEPTYWEKRAAELERFCGQLALENQVLKKALQAVPSRSERP